MTATEIELAKGQRWRNAYGFDLDIVGDPRPFMGLPMRLVFIRDPDHSDNLPRLGMLFDARVRAMIEQRGLAVSPPTASKGRTAASPRTW